MFRAPAQRIFRHQGRLGVRRLHQRREPGCSPPWEAGRLSVDRLLGLHTAGTPVTRVAVTAALGVAGAAVQLALFWRSPERAPREVA